MKIQPMTRNIHIDHIFGSILINDILINDIVINDLREMLKKKTRLFYLKGFTRAKTNWCSTNFQIEYTLIFQVSSLLCMDFRLFFRLFIKIKLNLIYKSTILIHWIHWIIVNFLPKNTFIAQFLIVFSTG